MNRVEPDKLELNQWYWCVPRDGVPEPLYFAWASDLPHSDYFTPEDAMAMDADGTVFFGPIPQPVRIH